MIESEKKVVSSGEGKVRGGPSRMKTRRWTSSVSSIERLPTSPALTKGQLLASVCGKKCRAAIKGIFDNLEVILNDITEADGTVREHSSLGSVNSEELSQNLLSAVRKMVRYSVRDDGVDYAKLKGSSLFEEYLNEARYLWFVNPSELKENGRKAFFMNIYNALVIHAIIEVGSPSTGTERMHFFSRAAYVIGGRIYSLNDIEHGILRGNRTSWQPLPLKPFTDYDARLKCAVPLDPRIHFALNCGARGCPAVRFYDENNLESALEHASKLFLQDLVVDPRENKVVLSAIFQWYQSDFGDNQTHVLAWILSYVDEHTKPLLARMIFESEKMGREIRISYAPYDWSLNEARKEM